MFFSSLLQFEHQSEPSNIISLKLDGLFEPKHRKTMQLNTTNLIVPFISIQFQCHKYIEFLEIIRIIFNNYIQSPKQK